MGGAAANAPRIGNHRSELQAQPGKDAAVGLVHQLVGLLQ